MPEMEESKKKASILVEALPYVRRFRGSIFVVKYGGSLWTHLTQRFVHG